VVEAVDVTFGNKMAGYVLKHHGSSRGSSGKCLDEGEGPSAVDGIPGVGAWRPFGIGPALEQQ